ncbi:hypothetical protein [Burkholderia vietnamiensis]|uniref:hypothetical protein n=1 Tax=Burkholderia vietnamiensis TaxID=60552 RepID=UPI003F68A3D1
MLVRTVIWNPKSRGQRMMDTVIQQNAALVEQAAAAHSLEEQAMDPSDAVSVFKASGSELPV